MLWVTKDYQQVSTRPGAIGPAIVFMGDSCTQFGTYPSRTLELLGRTRPSLGCGIKVGVAGWSVVQGKAQLVRDVLPLHPRG